MNGVYKARGEPLNGGCTGFTHPFVVGQVKIDLTLIKNQDWLPPTDPDDVEGDPYPDGTLKVIYESDMLITLKGTIPDTDVTGFTVDDRLQFHVIPVLVNEGTGDERTEYRLWKWRDLFAGP